MEIVGARQAFASLHRLQADATYVVEIMQLLRRCIAEMRVQREGDLWSKCVRRGEERLQSINTVPGGNGGTCGFFSLAIPVRGVG